jgi:DNA polymerase III subunit gamma/tau
MSEYRVLARKYRPDTFDDLIGQEVLVRTLSNAIDRGRIAHAFLLTGIRGTGKTTTARIIAKALNCLGEDGNSGPTIKPCGTCANCVAIKEDRHVDVMEMDAASRTGVDDIRDIIDSVHYAPTNARYKIYIIDEVHMLSKNAFNALLKTLEEPPPHVKFIFATTEIRKIPVTILSRCQRFDLKSIDVPMLTEHLQSIAQKESVSAEMPALKLIAAAAGGSVRDSLSLLDQAIAHGGEGDVITITTEAVSQMLGLTDKSRNFTLLESLFKGEVGTALEVVRDMVARGADASAIMQDVLEVLHNLTLRKSGIANSGENLLSPEDEQRAEQLVKQVSLQFLTHSWQLMLKAMQDIHSAPNPLMALEMAMMRAAHLASLPSPSEVIRKIQQQAGEFSNHATPAPMPAMTPRSTQVTSAAAAPVASVAPAMNAAPQPSSFDQVLALLQDRKEAVLYEVLYRDAQLVSFQQGRIEVNLSEMAPASAAGDIGKKLTELTGQRWVIVLSREQGQPSAYEQAQQQKQQSLTKAKDHPLVAEVLELIPGAKLNKIVQGD